MTNKNEDTQNIERKFALEKLQIKVARTSHYLLSLNMKYKDASKETGYRLMF